MFNTFHAAGAAAEAGAAREDPAQLRSNAA